MSDRIKESKNQRKMIDIIKKYGGYVYKNAQNIYTEKGRPDLTACIPVTIDKLKEVFGDNATVGIYLGLEVKVDEDYYDATEAQQIVGRKIKKAKGLWLKCQDPDIIEALMIKLTGGTDVIQ